MLNGFDIKNPLKGLGISDKNVLIPIRKDEYGDCVEQISICKITPVFVYTENNKTIINIPSIDKIFESNLSVQEIHKFINPSK